MKLKEQCHFLNSFDYFKCKPNDTDFLIWIFTSCLPVSFGRPIPCIRLDRQSMLFTARCCECYNSALGGCGISRVIGMLLWAITLIMDAEQKQDLDDFSIKLSNSSHNNSGQLHFLSSWVWQAPDHQLFALIFHSPGGPAGLVLHTLWKKHPKLMFKKVLVLPHSPVACGWRAGTVHWSVAGTTGFKTQVLPTGLPEGP